jgi:hypothetical protein
MGPLPRDRTPLALVGVSVRGDADGDVYRSAGLSGREPNQRREG